MNLFRKKAELRALMLFGISTILALFILAGTVRAEDLGELSLDLDKDGEVRPLTDGLLLLRSLFGFEGQSLVTGAVDPQAEVQDPQLITQEIVALNPYLDIDQDGLVRPLSDGLLILRALFGFEGESLTTGAVNVLEAKQQDPAGISEYIQDLKLGFRVALQVSGDLVAQLSEGGVATGEIAASHDLGDMSNLSFEIITEPAHGTAEINSQSGVWTYSPTAEYNGQDTIGVFATDDFGQATYFEITLTVAQVDDVATFGGDI
ncbi:MAG: Ig-like domain-containing protein, partial [Opitutae bacterium]